MIARGPSRAAALAWLEGRDRRPPQCGKSRLFNALVGFARAIVDPPPGTTRDVVSSRAVFGGWPVELADTAGLRETFDPVESIGIERSRREQQQADLVVLVLDRSVPLQPIDHELIAANPAAILAANKSDLRPPGTDRRILRAVESTAIVTVSAENGDGLSNLIDAIGRRLVPEPLPKGGAVPFRRDKWSSSVEIRAEPVGRRSSRRRRSTRRHGPGTKRRSPVVR